jgi:hypothetical protein
LTDVQQLEKREKDPTDPKDPAEAVLFHLLRHPCDLVDARRLMWRFRASAADVSRALGKFEMYRPGSAEELA